MKKYTVTLRNRNNLKVTVGDDEAIIDAVENMGHLLPIACRYGGCITCAAKLIDGKVKQPNATALNKRQSQDGYILLCCLLYTSPSPRDGLLSRMPSSA